jgi:hypothetical protein
VADGQDFSVGDMALFTGYTTLSSDMAPLFEVGAFMVVIAVEPDQVLKCLPTDHAGRPVGLPGDTVFPEEAIKLDYAPRVRVDALDKGGGTSWLVSGGASPDVAAILADPSSKVFRDLRDRAAYLFVTGTYPSHMRRFFTRALTLISRGDHQPVSLDGRSGNRRVNERVALRLGLDTHPMVVKVRQYVAGGYWIRTSLGPNARKPYTKVFLEKGGEQVTVQIDGSVLDHWPDA